LSVLDDLKMIHERDAQDALGIAEKQWQQLQYDYNISHTYTKEQISNVVVGGMGGSALAAEYIHSWPGISCPYEIVRGYNLPGSVTDKTLFIASSYSGNTEETLSTLVQAEEKGAIIVIIAAGGRLTEIASEKGYPLYQLPGGMQPRMAALYNLAALLQILEPTGLIGEGRVQELRTTADWLKAQTELWRADIPTTQNPAKQLALDIVGASPVIYGSTLTFPVAYKWKISFNENAKNIAWCGQYPEFNHNEFLGWTSHPVEKPYKVIDLRSTFDHPQVQKRFEISDRLLSGRRPAAQIVELQGDTILEQLLWGTAMGDFVSLYTALLNGLNPTPVELIERFKQELTK
jgi:glucose/mannose-6-phosphate isomerase